MGRNIVGYHTAGTDHYIISDRHSRKNNGIGTDPYVVANVDRQGKLSALAAVFSPDRMSRDCKRHIRPKHHVVADKDFTVIDDTQIEIRIKMMTDMRIAAVRKKGGGFNPDFLTRFRQKFI